MRLHTGRFPFHTIILRQKSFLSHFQDIQEHQQVPPSSLAQELSSLRGKKRTKFGHTYKVEPHGIISLTNLRDSQYVGPIGVGTLTDGSSEAEINVVFDTGSTNLWISSSLCHSRPCEGRAKFDPDQSDTFVKKTDSLLDITFGTGELRGPQGEDAFSVGPYRVVNQTFALIQDEIGSIFTQIPFEGILGLAFPSMAADGHIPFFDNVMTQDVLKGHNEFSFYFTKLPQQASAIFFGGVDDRFFEGKIKMFPVIQPHYWTIDLQDFLIGNESYAVIPKTGERITKLIVDTGTTYFTAPPGLADRILQRLPNSDCSGTSEYPDLTYRLVDEHGDSYDLIVPASTYMVSSGTSLCEAAFMEIPVPDEFGPAFLLGEVFMRQWHTTFERGDGSDGSAFIGFATARHDQQAVDALLKGHIPSGTIAGI